MNSQYEARRIEIDKLFETAKRLEDVTINLSPTGDYRLEVAKYSTGPNTWSYSRGIVTRVSDGKIIADVKRNYGHFWYCWVSHPNGKEYLLCGEDYQGYSTVNLTDERYHVFFPSDGYQGFGFCWTAVYPSPDRLVLAVDGCYWACPYELVFYDFNTPDELPYLELGRSDSLTECEGWQDNATFVLTRELEVRASDGVAYEDLSDGEQAALDADSSLVGYRTERVLLPRPRIDRVT